MKILFSNSYSFCGGELIYCVLVKKAYNGMRVHICYKDEKIMILKTFTFRYT